MIERIVREHPFRIGLACLCILLLIGIEFWNDYAPLGIHEWNKKEISRIKLTNPDHFTFAVFGDNKGNYSFFEPLLRDIDQDKEIAFAVDIGDLVADGKRGQYRRFLEEVRENLPIPFLTATGNHDYHNGFDEYRNIFGPAHYSFQLGRCTFIVLDSSNDSGFDKAEFQWLKNELNRSRDSRAHFIFMHIPPFHPGGGEACLPEKDRNDLLELFKRFNVTHLFASHFHGYFSGLWEGIPYTITGGAGARLPGTDPQHFFHHYVKVHFNNGKVDTRVRRVRAQTMMVSLYGFVEDYLYQGVLLLCAGICMMTLGRSVRRENTAEKRLP